MPVDRDEGKPSGAGQASAPDRDTQTLQLIEEVLQVSKRQITSGHVRVSVVVDTEDHRVHETLKSRRLEVEHLAVGRQLAPGDPMPQSRTEDGVLIVPMVEEILVVEKRLVVVEELHIRVVHSEEEVEHVLPLRRQRAVVERVRPDDDSVLPMTELPVRQPRSAIAPHSAPVPTSSEKVTSTESRIGRIVLREQGTFEFADALHVEDAETAERLSLVTTVRVYEEVVIRSEAGTADQQGGCRASS